MITMHDGGRDEIVAWNSGRWRRRLESRQDTKASRIGGKGGR